jgi:hypothetical protein
MSFDPMPKPKQTRIEEAEQNLRDKWKANMQQEYRRGALVGAILASAVFGLIEGFVRLYG